MLMWRWADSSLFLTDWSPPSVQAAVNTFIGLIFWVQTAPLKDVSISHQQQMSFFLQLLSVTERDCLELVSRDSSALRSVFYSTYSETCIEKELHSFQSNHMSCSKFEKYKYLIKRPYKNNVKQKFKFHYSFMLLSRNVLYFAILK